MLHRLAHMSISFDAETCKNRDLGPERFAEAVPLACANGYNPTTGVRDCPSHGCHSSLPPEPTAIVTSSRILMQKPQAKAATSRNWVIALPRIQFLPQRPK